MVVVAAMGLMGVRRVVAIRAVRMVVVPMVMALVPVPVVVIVVGLAKKVRVDIQRGIEVKSAQIKYVFQVHGAKVRHMVGRTRVHVLEAVGERVQGLGADQV